MERKKLFSYSEWLLNEAGEAPAPAAAPADDFTFDEDATVDPATPADPNAPAPDPNAPADPNAPVDPNAPADPMANASMGADLGGGAAGAPPAGGMTGGMPGGGGMGAPMGAEGGEVTPEPSFKPSAQNFPIVINNPEAKWSNEYPDGGGIKKMKGYDISWGSLEDWMKENDLSDKAEDITNFLSGKENKLNDEVKAMIKKGLENEDLGTDMDDTEIEFDDDNVPYTGDLNTVIVDFKD